MIEVKEDRLIDMMNSPLAWSLINGSFKSLSWKRKKDWQITETSACTVFTTMHTSIRSRLGYPMLSV